MAGQVQRSASPVVPYDCDESEPPAGPSGKAGGFVWRIGAAAVMASGMLAQVAGPGSTPFDWSGLISGALGSSPVAIVLAWRLFKADRAEQAREAKIDAMHQRDVEMVEKMAPLLADATRALAEVQSGMRATMRDSRPAPDVASVVGRLEALMEDMSRQPRRGQP